MPDYHILEVVEEGMAGVWQERLWNVNRRILRQNWEPKQVIKGHKSMAAAPLPGEPSCLILDTNDKIMSSLGGFWCFEVKVW